METLPDSKRVRHMLNSRAKRAIGSIRIRCSLESSVASPSRDFSTAVRSLHRQDPGKMGIWEENSYSMGET